MSKRSRKHKGCFSELNSSPNIEQTELYDQLTKIEEMIHSKLSEAKKLRRLNYLCEHTNAIKQKGSQSSQSRIEGPTVSEYETITLPEYCKQYNEGVNYYDLFWKLFLINENTAWKVHKLYDNVEEMQTKTKEIQELLKNREQLLKESEAMGIDKVTKKKTKSRKKLDDKLVAKISCPYQHCYRDYCSQISLNLHVKLKHNAGNKTERQMYAVILCLIKEKIWKARQLKKPQPLIPLCFSPGYIEEYGMLTGRISPETYEKEKKIHKWVEFQVDRKLFQKTDQQDAKKSEEGDKLKREN